MTPAGPGRAIREGQQAPPGAPPRVNPMPLADLPDVATPREAAARMTYAQAIAAADSILEQIKAGTFQRPYPYNVRHTLRICAEVFRREATP